MTTEEGNRLIVPKTERELIERFMGYPEGYLSEVIRWNDIMPVVEKIEGLNDEWGFNVRIAKNNTAIFHLKPLSCIKVSESISFIKIEAVYQAVLQFITWYNSLSHQQANK